MKNTRTLTNPNGGFSVTRKATARLISNCLQHSPTQFLEIVKENKTNFNRDGKKKKNPRSPAKTFPGEKRIICFSVLFNRQTNKDLQNEKRIFVVSLRFSAVLASGVFGSQGEKADGYLSPQPEIRAPQRADRDRP